MKVKTACLLSMTIVLWSCDGNDPTADVGHESGVTVDHSAIIAVPLSAEAPVVEPVQSIQLLSEPDTAAEEMLREQQMQLEAAKELQLQVQEEMRVLREQIEASNRQLQLKQKAADELSESLSRAPAE